MGKNGSRLRRTTAVTLHTLHPRKADARMRIVAYRRIFSKTGKFILRKVINHPILLKYISHV